MVVAVPDVQKFPVHIFCSNLCVSEIVIPVVSNDVRSSVLSVYNKELSFFDLTDRLAPDEIAGDERRVGNLSVLYY